MQDRVRLIIQGVTDIPSVPDTSLIVLTDEKSERTISIVCDNTYRQQIAIRRGKFLGSEEAQQNVRDSLKNAMPEVFIKILHDLLFDYQVVITHIFSGEYKAILTDPIRMRTYNMRISDALLLAFASEGTMPIYAEKDMWLRQSTPYPGDNANGIALPLNALSIEMLKDALEKCVEEEHYEAAQQIKEELDRRNTK